MAKKEQTKRKRVYAPCKGPSKTRTEFSKESDINWIIKQYVKTGGIPPNLVQMTYGDVSKLPDYQGALQTVATAKEMFMQLPAEVRSRFDNDPQKLLTFMESDNPKHKAEAIELGLLPKPKEEKPTPSTPQQKTQTTKTETTE